MPPMVKVSPHTGDLTMAADFIPANDAELLTFSAAFSEKITLAPTSYGLVAGNATTLASLQSAYASSLAAAVDPETRGGSTVFAKAQARVNLVAYIRLLARAIQGTISVTNQQRYELGLTVRKVEPTPIPAPAFAPTVDVRSVTGTTVRIRLHDAQNPTRRGKPYGVAGASVFSYVGTGGASAPAELTAWKFEGNCTRTVVDVVFPAETTPGAKIWICAFWFNPRTQQGPTSEPVSTRVQGGLASAAA
jgi:hypothetical protein